MKTEIDSSKVLCRICGEEYCSSLCLAVFSEAGIQQQLQYKINQLLRIQISPQGNMPKQICHTCLNRLDAAYDLFKLCESVQDSIQQKVTSQAQFNGDVHILENHHLISLEQKCKSLTENSPIMIGGLVLKLKQSHLPVQTESATPISQIPQPVLPQIPHNQNIVANLNNWVPQQQTEPVPVQLGYTEMVPQPAQTAPVQYNQLQNGAQNITNANCFQAHQAAIPQQVVSNVNPAKTGKEIQKSPLPKPMIGRKGKKVPRPIPCPPPSRPSPLCKKPQGRNMQEAEFPRTTKPMRQCQYCKKHFAEDIIDHHVNLHLRKAFFTCIDCNKNFRTERGLEKHRCGRSEGDN